MLQKTKALVLKVTPYSESSVVARMYTEEFGLQSYLINGVRSGKGSIKPAHLMPLNLLDLVVYFREGASLQRIKELRCSPILKSLHADVYKNSIAVFMMELLGQVLHNEEMDAPLYTFLETSIGWLDETSSSLAHFPHFFMAHLCRYLGIQAQGELNQKHLVFDLQEGAFVPEQKAGLLRMNTNCSELMSTLLNCKANELNEIKSKREDRQLLLSDLIQYYRIHEVVTGPLKTQQILVEIFRDQ